MDLQEFKTESEEKKRWEMPQTPGQKGILVMDGGEAPLWAADPQHPGLTPGGGFPPLCTKVPESPTLPNHWIWLHFSTCADEVSHEEEKAQLTLCNGFFKSLIIFVTL